MPIARQQQRAATMVSALAILVSTAALAHTRLTGSMPSDGAAVGSPSAIVLEFSEPVHVTAVTLLTSAGGESPTGEIPEGPAVSFAVPVSGTLGPDTYTVRWRAVSADTHIVSGEFSFIVAREEAPAASGDSDGSVQD